MTPNGPKAEIHAQRRRRMLEAVGADALVFIAGPPEAVYSNDVCYRYRPDTNIRYLAGYEDPACLMFGGPDGEFTLFVEGRDPERERWTGPRLGPEGAAERYGACHAHALEDWPGVLAEALGRTAVLYYDPPLEARAAAKLRELIKANGGLELRSAAELFGEFRVVKEAEEIEVMRQATAISARAHRDLAERLRPGMAEYEIEAAIEHEFRRAGCAGPAYPTIAASGSNATILHYTRNDRTTCDGDLLLLDAGGEWGGYCADITRTIPVGASYSAGQREIYEVVLEAQKVAIEAVAPGTSYQEVNMRAVTSMVPAMIELGLLEGSTEECIESGAYTSYYMHRTGHWLGMDVHDPGSYGDNGARLLEPGMVLTVEPGIYVPEDAACPRQFRGIGVRIEDDVLVTAGGHEVLTTAAPKETTELEELRARALA